jgi:hypothetical protein
MATPESKIKRGNTTHYKLKFTEEQIYEELKCQCSCTKGITGVYLFYRAVGIHYQTGERYIKEQTFKDCGFDIDKIKNDKIALGEFYLTRCYFLFQSKWEITKNETLFSLLS